MVQWSDRSPFTSEVAGSILSGNVLNVTRIECSTRVKRVSQHSAESRGLSPGAPQFHRTRKLSGWVRINADSEVRSQLL